MKKSTLLLSALILVAASVPAQGFSLPFSSPQQKILGGVKDIGQGMVDYTYLVLMKMSDISGLTSLSHNYPKGTVVAATAVVGAGLYGAYRLGKKSKKRK